MSRTPEQALCQLIDAENTCSIPESMYNGINVNYIFEDNRTLLMVAVSSGHADACVQLLARGANVQQDTQTILHSVVRTDHAHILSILLRSIQNIDIINQQDESGATAFSIAACRLQKEMMQCLQNVKADINIPDYTGSTPLCLAIYNQQMELAACLLRMQANVSIPNIHGYTPLHCAAYNGNVEQCSLLLTNKADIHAAEGSGVTPLFLAAQNNHLQAVMLLVQSNANLNEINENGDACLLLAVQESHTDVVRYLLQQQAYVHSVNKDGYNALLLAAKQGHLDICKDLVQFKADVNACNIDDLLTPLHIATYHSHHKLLSYLLHVKSEIDTPDSTGGSCLHLAVDQGDVKAVKMLVECKADIAKMDHEQITPLDQAKDCNDAVLVEYLEMMLRKHRRI